MTLITSTTKQRKHDHIKQYVDSFHQPFQRSHPAAIYMTSLILRVTNFIKQTLFEKLQSLGGSKKKFPHLMETEGSWAATATPPRKPYEAIQIHPTSQTSLFNVTLPFKPPPSISLSFLYSADRASRYNSC
jgi:hypothetical protein